MVSHGEKIIFGFLGAITAIVVSLAVFYDYQKPTARTPASQTKSPEPVIPYQYLID